MNIGIYQSAAALSALDQWQNAVAQNITSSSSSGFRQRVVSFGAALGGSWQVGTSPDSAENVQAVFPTATTAVSYQPGQTERTGRDLDVAIQGNGFFQVRQADGTVAYTRNGQFNARADHMLVTQSGAEVLSTSGGPITLLPSGESITIDSDGTIVQGQTTLGRLSVKSFASDQTLVPTGDG
ncbi:MAG: flagellar hook-basal body complex protein, partial [Terracidiphilus sp.]